MAQKTSEAKSVLAIQGLAIGVLSTNEKLTMVSDDFRVARHPAAVAITSNKPTPQD